MIKTQNLNIIYKIFSLLFICFFIFLLIYYLSSKVFLAPFNVSTAINLIILSINLLFWLWALLSKNTLKSILVVSYFSIILSLYASEFYIEKKNKNEQFKYFLEQNKNYDTRSKFEIYKDLKKTQTVTPLYYPYNQLIKKRKIFANINETQKEILILSGVANRKTIVCNETGEYLIYLSDRYGFNNPNEIWNSLSDAVVLGDSMTLGECVAPGKDISSLLRIKNNKVITNLGMGGNGPLFQLATLKEYQPLTKSNKIIWIYYEGNDLLDLYNEKKNKLLLNYLDSNFKQDLYKNQNLIDKKILGIIDQEYRDYRKTKFRSFFLLWSVRENIKDFFQTNKKKSFNNKSNHKTKIPSMYQKLVSINSNNPYVDNIDLYEKILYEVHKFSIKNNTTNYFVYLPAVARFNGEFKDEDELFARKDILKIVKKFNFKLIDTYEEYFKKQKKPLEFYPYNGKRRHFNSKGYEVISDIISQEIYKN